MGLDTWFDRPKEKPKEIEKPKPSPPSNYVDVNIAEEECKRYVPGRLRCDEKDPSGMPCMFFSMGCGIRSKRFKGAKP